MWIYGYDEAQVKRFYTIGLLNCVNEFVYAVYGLGQMKQNKG